MNTFCTILDYGVKLVAVVVLATSAYGLFTVIVATSTM